MYVISNSSCFGSLIVGRFVEQWVFLGQLDCGVEFGIYGNQDALERRGIELIKQNKISIEDYANGYLR